MSLKDFKQFLLVSEKEEDKKSSAPAEPQKEEPVDASKGTIKDIEVNSKNYKAVLSTWKSIMSKQSAMGKDAVGVISIPGEEEVYELMIEKKEEENE
jgi:hypothetical protein